MARPPAPQAHLLSSIRPDGSRVGLHPAEVKGRFMRLRRWVFYALIAIYVALPFTQVGGHPSVHLDIAQRQFFLFGAAFNAQDVWLGLLLITTLAFTLLFVTAWLGRAWCGWACPQTVFLEGVYRRVEALIEGPAERRQKRAAGPWNAERVGRAAVKHGAFLVISWALAHVALALFVPVDELWSFIRSGPAGHEVTFGWAVVTTGLLHFNFGFFREQLCVIVCPYGRLQSVMTDKDSLIVGYDVRRGEPRGKLLKLPVVDAPKLGDCVDCRRCIQVCPTGIDIRNGLQLECLACAQCVDACDEVMDKVGRPQGLIRFDSLRGLNEDKRKTLRPRLVAYGALLLVSSSALGMGLMRRSPFEANLLRARATPYLLDGESLRNQFELHLVNKHPEPAEFTLQVSSGTEVTAVVAQPTVTLPPMGSHRVPIFLTVDRKAFRGPFDVVVEVTDHTAGRTRRIDARFLGPSGPPGPKG